MRGPLASLVLRRTGQTLLTLLLMTLVVHGSLALLPGDPIRGLFGFRRPDPAVYDAIAAQFRFDRPWIVQYVLYLRDLVTGNWGHSFPGQVRFVAEVGPPISELIKRSLPPSLLILGPTLAIQVGAGTLAGAFMAASRGRLSARAAYLVAVALLGIPVLALAYFLQAFLAWRFGWFPTHGLAVGWTSYVLPVASLSLTATALVALLTRAQVRGILGETYIRAAQARALPHRRIVGVHALRPSIMPTITFVAANFGQLLTGLIVVEGIFGIPGFGGLVFQAILQGDRALLITCLVLVTATVSLLSLAADIAHMIVDPRVRKAG